MSTLTQNVIKPQAGRGSKRHLLAVCLQMSVPTAKESMDDDGSWHLAPGSRREVPSNTEAQRGGSCPQVTQLGADLGGPEPWPVLSANLGCRGERSPGW